MMKFFPFAYLRSFRMLMAALRCISSFAVKHGPIALKAWSNRAKIMVRSHTEASALQNNSGDAIFQYKKHKQ